MSNIKNIDINKILVAVDFSDCSMNAFKHALGIASQLNCDIVLTWVFNDSFKFFSSQSNEEEEITWAENTFEDIWRHYAKDIPNNELKLLIKKGIVAEQIINAAEEVEAQLIVTGTYGRSGFKDLIMGSNAFKLLKESPIPLLTINDHANTIKPIKNILLPIDSTIESSEKKEIAALMATLFNANIHILQLYSEQDNDFKSMVNESSQQVIDYLNKHQVAIATEKQMYGSNITNLTLEHINNNDFDLVIIMTEQEISTKNIWMGTYARQLIKQSSIPVLSINPGDYYQFNK